MPGDASRRRRDIARSGTRGEARKDVAALAYSAACWRSGSTVEKELQARLVRNWRHHSVPPQAAGSGWRYNADPMFVSGFRARRQPITYPASFSPSFEHGKPK